MRLCTHVNRWVILGFVVVGVFGALCGVARASTAADVTVLLGEYEQAMEAEDYGEAVRAARQILQAGRGGSNAAVTPMGRQLLDEAQAVHQRWLRQRRALEATAEGPADDERFNEQAGRFYSFVRGDWERGLGLLAASGGSRLADLAERDAAEPSDAGEQLELADAWWELARRTDPDRDAMRERAVQWYREALSALEGEARGRADTRIVEVLGGSYVPDLVRLWREQGADMAALAPAVRFSDIVFPSGYLEGRHIYFSYHMRADNASHRGVLEDVFEVNTLLLLRDGDGRRSVMQLVTGVDLAQRGAQEVRVGDRLRRVEVEARHGGEPEPDNMLVEIRLGDVVIQRLFLREPRTAWWLDESLLE